MISVGVRLAAFNLKQIANLTCTDELDLYSIGEKKVALFCCIPDADTSMNYLVGMIYSNLFQTLYYVADRKYGGRLPIPVHCIMDEWPNVALPDDFDKILATMRSRGISCSIIIQNIAQMKALFKDSYESLIGNCDEFLYLGGNEKEGHKYVSELLGSPPAVGDTGVSAVTIVWNYVGELVFNLLVLVGAIKASDRIVREMMGLGG